MPRITTKSELKDFLIKTKITAEKYREINQDKYFATIQLCDEILDSYLKYVIIKPLDPDDFKDLKHQCISIYKHFLQSEYNCPAKIKSEDNKAMDEIIQFLFQITPDKKKVIDSWFIILSKWRTYPHNIKNYTKLRHINRNLQIIISNLKNRRKNGQFIPYIEKTKSQHIDEFKQIAAELTYRKDPSPGK